VRHRVLILAIVVMIPAYLLALTAVAVSAPVKGAPGATSASAPSAAAAVPDRGAAVGYVSSANPRLPAGLAQEQAPSLFGGAAFALAGLVVTFAALFAVAGVASRELTSSRRLRRRWPTSAPVALPLAQPAPGAEVLPFHARRDQSPAPGAPDPVPAEEFERVGRLLDRLARIAC
jgi:hypothetical protein